MKNTILGIFLSLFCLQCISQASNPESDPQLAAKTEKIRDGLIHEDYNKVTADFNSQMSAALKPEQLKQVWEGLIQQLGNYDSYGDISSSEIEGYRVIYSILKFEKAPIKLKVVFDDDDNVAGLFFVPVNAQ